MLLKDFALIFNTINKKQPFLKRSKRKRKKEGRKERKSRKNRKIKTAISKQKNSARWPFDEACTAIVAAMTDPKYKGSSLSEECFGRKDRAL